MRKRERDEAGAAARRRLEALSVELDGLRAERPAFFEEQVPVQAGPPGGLPGATVPAWAEPDRPPPGSRPPPPPGADQVVRAARGRPLPPDPVRVATPGRHAVDRPGGAVGERVEDWMDQRLPDVVRRRVALGGQHLVVLTGVLGLALAVAGWLALRGGSGEEAAPRAEFVAQRAAVGGSSASPSAAPSAGATATGTVVVDVVGKVRRPGIVTLPTGSRVTDAVQHAGGVLPGTRTTSLNMARLLVDGEQIVVGKAAGAAPPVASPGAPAATGAMVNLNTAGLTELDTLPGVGPVTAQKILDWRSQHGSFTAVDQLLDVDGIGDKTLADIAPHVTL